MLPIDPNGTQGGMGSPSKMNPTLFMKAREVARWRNGVGIWSQSTFQPRGAFSSWRGSCFRFRGTLTYWSAPFLLQMARSSR